MPEDRILEEHKNFKTLVENTGDEVIDEKSVEHEEGHTLNSILATRSGNQYSIDAIDDTNYVHLIFNYDVFDDFIAKEVHKIGEEKVEKEKETDTHIKLSDDDYEQLSKLAKENMTEFFEGIDDNVAERFHISVLDKLKNSSISYNVHRDQGLVSGFNVHTKLFPLERDITHKEFHDSVASILSIGCPTRAYIQYSYGLHEFNKGPIISDDQFDHTF